MTSRGFLLHAGALAVCLLIVRPARSQERSSCALLDRANVARCAVTASLPVKADELLLASLAGRRRAAATLLPSNPTVSLTGGIAADPTVAPGDREALWSASLSQEVEIAGQRGRRIAVTSAEQSAQTARTAAARRAAAADAMLLYFDALAATAEARLGDRLATLASSLTAVARGRAQAGLGAELEAQVAEAAAAKLLQAQLVSRTRLTSARAALSNAVGRDPTQATVEVRGDLVPLAHDAATTTAFTDAAVARRAEIQVARAERLVQEGRVALYERLRVPNPTLSVFARNDWINERSVGVGVSFPIPLPSSLGRTYAGEIAEASALAERAATEAERIRRAVRLEVTQAVTTWEMRKRQMDLYPPASVERADATLESITQEIEARRLPVRDALLAQQALIDFLFASVEAKRQLCLASVELARAAGLALDGGSL